MVSNLSVIFIIINLIIGMLFPIFLLIYFRKKYNTSIKVFFYGCATMLVFAFLIEQLFHSIVLSSPFGSFIQNNTYVLAIYGGLMAGLFEEVGRFVCMRFLLKKEHDNKYNAYMYGAGHGGFEMFVVLFFTMINNLIFAIMINTGAIDSLLNSLDSVVVFAVEGTIDTLINTPSYSFIFGLIERFSAIIAHMGLSMIVWKASVYDKDNIKYLLLAILLHALLDSVSLILTNLVSSIIIVESIIMIICILIFIFARRVFKHECETN